MRSKHNVMRRLASQIRFRNAVVAALAMLAVVLISTSLPVDKVVAQTLEPEPDAEIAARANAWWAVLTDDQKVRAIVGFNNITPEQRAAIIDGTNLNIRRLVNGDTTDAVGDVYAVGEESSRIGDALRGIQSVDLWWSYMTCVEKNIATGTNNAPTTDGVGYCQAYSDLDAASLAHANRVGMAILGLDEPGVATSENIENAANWWNRVGSINKSAVIFGEDHGETDNIVNDYSDLNDVHRTLVNDRWRYVYDIGGNDIEKWWNGLSCVQRTIAIGLRSDPVLNVEPQCTRATYDALVAVPPGNTDGTLSSNAITNGGDVIDFAQSILGIAPIPDVAGWWDALSNQQRVNVIFGDPPLWYGMADKTNPTRATAEQTAPFEKPYSELSGGFDWNGANNSSNMSPAIENLIQRSGEFPDWCSVTMQFADPQAGILCPPDQLAYSSLVRGIAHDIWDPPEPDAADFGGTGKLDEFDPPYDSVAQWWAEKDCRSKRLALGEDQVNLDPGVEDDPNTDINEYVAPETSAGGYCRFYPGDPAAMGDPDQWLTPTVQARVHEIALALRVILQEEMGRPVYNEEPAGRVKVVGPAAVGETMMVDISGITDPDGLPTDPAAFTYQWLRDGTPIPGATGTSYVLTAADAGAIISVTVSFVDNERYLESITGRAGSPVGVGAASGGGISRIEPAIRSVTVSAGDEVVLQVNIYGLQGAQEQSLGNGVMFTWMQDGNSIDGMSSTLTYTAPSSPGAYRVVASLEKEDCRPADDADFETACSAEFEVRVRRPAAAQPADEPPVNPPGEIPTILTDSQGAQYEVFTPVEGGTFDAGEGYSIMAPAGAVPNGEYIGVRMSDDGMASNAGVTSHRYTLGGNMYGIHAVDSTGASVTDYVLEDPARVCVPLPDVLRAQISDLALVTINSDNTLTILAANVRLGTSGTSVCGNLSNLPASVAVGSFGSPDAIPTATPEPTPIPPETGASSPSSNSAVWALLLGIAVLSLGSFIILGRRRGNIRA